MENTKEDIIKRLQLIQNLIALGDFEIIDKQIEILCDQANEQLEPIIDALNNKAYGDVSRLIKEFFSSQASLLKYEDPELAGFRLELQALESQLVELQNRKSEIEKQVYQFNIRYQQELGEMMETYLRLRREKYKVEAEDDPEKEFVYEEAKTEHEEYKKVFDEHKDEVLNTLTEQEEAEIRNLYREATKLCHPDVVSEDQKEESHKIFVVLKDAYESNDLDQVKMIYASLKSGRAFTVKSDSINDLDIMREEIAALRNLIKKIQIEIKELEESEAFLTLTAVDDLDEYLEELKMELRELINSLVEDNDG